MIMRKLATRFPTWALWLCTAITLLAGTLLLLALVLGVRAGQQQLEIKRRQQIGLTLQRAFEAHSAGELVTARTAYEEVLVLDANNSAAIHGLTQIQQLGPVIMTATHTISESASVAQSVAPPATALTSVEAPTVIALPTATTPTNDVSQLMLQAEAAYSAGRWVESVEQLLEIRRRNAAYDAAHVNELLFTAYINLASEKDNQNKLEEALTLYDKALALDPNAAEVRQERRLIADYLEVLTYSGVDWERSTLLLRNLYVEEPDYRDIKERFHEALLSYGAQQGDDSAWCEAAKLLTEAIAIDITPGLIAERDQYQAACADPASVAAGATVTATVSSATPGAITTAVADATTPTAPAVNAVAPGTLGRGSILYSAADVTTGRNRIMQQSVAGGAATVLREDAMQPAMRQDGQRLLFRNMRNDMAGISAWDPATNLLLRFTNYAEDSLPTWNPQSNRIAFASNREGDRIWRIYLAWAEDNGETNTLGIGEAPDWHPFQDTIAFRGCDDTGNRCGIWTIDAAGGDRAPLTTTSADNRPAWSPDGRYVVFMSDGRDGNFELYRVDATTDQVLRLTNAPAIDGLPTVSPDGGWVAFASNRNGGWQLWAVPLAGGNAVPIAPIAGNFDNWLGQDIQWIR
jgi:TolB protein